MELTTRLGLNKPDSDPVTGDFLDVDKLNENSDKIDASISFTPCLSTGRPPVPFQGQAILETDTGKTYVWGGSGWLPLLIATAPVQLSSNLGIGGAPNANTLRKIEALSSGTNGALSQVLLRQTGPAAASRALSTMGGGDTQDHWWVDFDGKMQWGPGNAGGDTTLYRAAADTLKTDDNFQVGGVLTVGGVEPGDSRVDTFTANGTWTVPAGAKRIWVRMVGGGGAGGGATTSVAGAHSKGGGGGAGEYVELWYNPSDLGATVPIVVGAGGVGDTSGGASGGTTSFGGVTALGGGGGSTNTSNSAAWGQPGGPGGTGGTGAAALRSSGGGGSFAFGSGALAAGGAGGSSALGGGGRGNSSGATIASVIGDDAKGYGGGGGGANVNTTGADARGGHGKAGVVIITTFF